MNVLIYDMDFIKCNLSDPLQRLSDSVREAVITKTISVISVGRITLLIRLTSSEKKKLD